MDNNNLPITQEDINSVPTLRMEEYQAFYHWLNAKPDSEIKIFPNNRRFKFDDIKELNGKIAEKLKLHKIVSNSSSITLFLSNRRVLEFGSWDKFINHDFAISAETKAISIIWDFYIQLESYKLPQRHTIKLRIGSHLKPGEFIQLLWQGDDELAIEEAASHVVCKVDFINPVICNELFGIVSEWHEALTKNIYQNKNHNVLKRHHAKIESSLVVLFLVAGTFVIAPILNLINAKYHFITADTFHISPIIIGLSAWAIAMYVFYIMGRFYSDRTSKLIDNISPLYYFEVTKGDRNKIEESKADNKKIVGKIIKEFSIALVIDIIAFLFWKLLKMI